MALYLSDYFEAVISEKNNIGKIHTRYMYMPDTCYLATVNRCRRYQQADGVLYLGHFGDTSADYCETICLQYLQF